MFALQNSSDDSDSDQSQVIFHQQILSLDTSIPIPSIKLQILPSKFQRPVPAIGLIDTGAQRSMLNPHILPPKYWTEYKEHFKAVNGKLFTTSLITKNPIGIQIFPNCVIWTKVIGSTLPNIRLWHPSPNLQTAFFANSWMVKTEEKFLLNDKLWKNMSFFAGKFHETFMFSKSTFSWPKWYNLRLFLFCSLELQAQRELLIHGFHFVFPSCYSFFYSFFAQILHFSYHQ